MGKLILYYLEPSPPCRAVALLAKEIGLEMELRTVNILAEEQKTPDYLKINPTGTFPALDDNGFYVYESHAIMIYLMEKYSKNKTLYPKDIELRSKIHSILHVETGLLFGRFRTAIEPIFYHEETVIPQFLINNLINSLDRFETLLSHSGEFLAGDNVTIADISCIPTISAYEILVSITKAKYPNIIQWKQRMFKRFSWLKEQEDRAATIVKENMRIVIANRIKKS